MSETFKKENLKGCRGTALFSVSKVRACFRVNTKIPEHGQPLFLFDSLLAFF